MNEYNENNLPKKYSTAYKIWLVLSPNVESLHYNPNCYGRGKILGGGTWACDYSIDGERVNSYFTGIEDHFIKQMEYTRSRIGLKDDK